MAQKKSPNAEKCSKLEERINAGQFETEELYEENRRLFLENKKPKGELK